MIAARLIPRVEFGHWTGGALSDDGSPHGDSVHGMIFAIQWFGLMIEIGTGRVSGRAAK